MIILFRQHFLFESFAEFNSNFFRGISGEVRGGRAGEKGPGGDSSKTRQ